VKELLVICNEEDTDGRARVTRDEERPSESQTKCKLCTSSIHKVHILCRVQATVQSRFAETLTLTLTLISANLEDTQTSVLCNFSFRCTLLTRHACTLPNIYTLTSYSLLMSLRSII